MQFDVDPPGVNPLVVLATHRHKVPRFMATTLAPEMEPVMQMKVAVRTADLALVIVPLKDL